MSTIQIKIYEQNLILHVGVSELLILKPYVKELKALKDPRAFSHFFMTKALVNRAARKLFESWLKKDQSVWPRMYKMISEMSEEEFQEELAQPEEQVSEVIEETEKKGKKTSKVPKADKSEKEKREKKLNPKAVSSKRSLEGVKPTQKKTRKKV